MTVANDQPMKTQGILAQANPASPEASHAPRAPGSPIVAGTNGDAEECKSQCKSFLTQAQRILACPHMQWEPQARELLPVMEGLVKIITGVQLVEAEMLHDLKWHSFERCLPDCPKCRLRVYLNFSAPPQPPATPEAHQSGSETGDARTQADSFICPFCQKPSSDQFPHGECIYRERARDEMQPTTMIP